MAPPYTLTPDIISPFETTRTDSRDLAQAVEEGLLHKKGDKRTTVYHISADQ